MKLTEQQLAQMFRQSKTTEGQPHVGDLYASTQASDQRLSDVEMIADNSDLSASYHIINQLQDWSQAIGTDIELSLKPRLTASLLNWLRPTLATAAIVTTVYFITPEIDNQINRQQKTDNITFASSFENNSDIIKATSFDKGASTNNQSDIITKLNFG
jgi:hypothetical protein